MLSIAFLAMLVSLNLQGYIKAARLEAAEDATQGTLQWKMQYSLGISGNPFHIPLIAQFAEPGEIMDPTGAGDP